MIRRGDNYRARSSSSEDNRLEDIMDTVSVYVDSAGRNMCARSQQPEDATAKGNDDDDNNTLEEARTFPWLPKFSRVIRSAIRNKNYQNLERLIALYTQNVVSSMAASKADFDDRVNLMSHVSNVLIFCHLYWLDVKQDVADHNPYLRRMSALLNVYIDMELKVSMEKKSSRHVRNSTKIAAKILAALYIYLNNSEEHIFRVLLRIKHTTEKYTKICNYIFTKSFDNTVVRKSAATPITDVAYVRYLLALKMWKKMDKISDKKERINNTAVSLLGLRMPKLRNELMEFVPRSPADQENETLWLLQSNLLDLKQVHKYFLLFEDKMDSFADLQRTKMTSQASQSCPKSQKHQVTSIFRRNITSGVKPNHEASNPQNYAIIPNANRNKFPDQPHLQRKRARSFKPLKKNKQTKPGKTIIIDLTGDDEISIPCKVKRKRIKRNIECLKIMKNKQKFQKHINPLKCSSRLVNGQRTGESFTNKDGKSSVEKAHPECKLAFDKIHDNVMDGGISIGGKFPLNHINLQKSEHSGMTRSQIGGACPEFGKEDDTKQHDCNPRHLKSPMLVDQDVKEFKFPTSVSKESKLAETRVPETSHVMAFMTENTANTYGTNPIMQSKQAFIAQDENATEAIPLFMMCQDGVAEQPSFKQESPAGVRDANAMQKSHKCCETMSVDMHDIKHLIIKELKSINDHNSQITEIIKQKECHQVNECPNCCAKIDCKPIVFINNDVTTTKAQDSLHNTLDDSDVKLAYDTNITYMLSDRNKCVYVVNHIGERVMTMHAEKRMQCLDKSSDTCTIPAAFANGDQIVESPLCNQHVNFNNLTTVSDYGNAAKYSDVTMKEQQQQQQQQQQQPLLCPHIVQCSEIPPNLFKFYKMKSYTDANPKAENDLRSFPKMEETDEITKADYVDDLFSVMHQINYDSSTDLPIKKLFVYSDNDVSAIKAQDALQHMFNDKKNDVTSPCDANVTYMHAEKRVQCLDKSGDTCAIPIIFAGDQIVESPLCGQHVNFNALTMSDYGNAAKYSEAGMKEGQQPLLCSHIVQCGEMPPNLFKFYKMKSYAGTNPKADNDLKSFPKVEEADEITKADYVDDLFSVMHQVNYNDNTTGLPIKKSLVYTDVNDVSAAKAQDALHMLNESKRNDVTSSSDANVTYMLTDHDKCVYVANHTGERVTTTSAEKRAQRLDNFSDMCTVSSTLIGEQTASSLENQYAVDFDNKRKSDCENDLKYSEVMMKEQGRIDCNTSSSNDRILHSSESCIFDINSFVMDSKEANEMIDCIDFENIEDVLSNDTIDFLLPLKQSSFELDNIYTDTFLNEKSVLCNDQNDAIDSINSIAFCLNTD